MSFTTTHRASLFELRHDIRRGRLFVLLDATGFNDLTGQLLREGLTFETLFDGEDALLLSGEAPYLIEIRAQNTLSLKRILQGTRQRHAGFAMISNASLDGLRRHWKGWLIAGINEGADMALFRFYDSRVLLAFISTLSSAEAQSFMGPSERLILVQPRNVLDISLKTSPMELLQSGVAPRAMVYQIDSHQMEVFSAVTDSVFREKIESYLRRVFWEDAEDISNEDMAALIEAAIGDCARLGACRESEVVDMAVTRVLRPDLVADDAYWDAVIDQTPNPKQRSGLFTAEVAYGMTREQKELFYAKLNYWWDFGKDGL